MTNPRRPTADPTTTISPSEPFTARYAQLELRILKEERWPGGTESIELLDRWGMTRQPQECIWVIAFDSSLHLRTVFEVARGTLQGADLHIPSLIAAITTAGAERFWLVHNHPSGDVRATPEDLQTTVQIRDAAAVCGLFLEDHVIIGPQGQFTSLAKLGYFTTYPTVPAVSET